MAPGELARQWFVTGDGIDRHVIVADIQRYLGNDATVRPGMGTGENEGVPGYWIKAYRNLTTAMIADLRATSGRWSQEQRITGTRGSQSPIVKIVPGITVPDPSLEPYVGSSTHANLSGRQQPGRGGDSPSVEQAYGQPSSRDRMATERMPADRRAVDRMDIDRMQIDPPSAQGPERRYAPERNGYQQPDPRQYPQEGRGFPPDNRAAYPPQEPQPYGRAPPVSSSYAQDPNYPRPGYPQQSNDGVPPGYMRQGNYYVPVSSSSFDQPSILSRADPSVYGISNPYGQPMPQPPRNEPRDPRDIRDPRDPRDPRDTRDRDPRDPRDQRDPRDPRYQPDYPQDPRYAYPSPAATVSSVNRGEREPITSPPQQSPYGAVPSAYDPYGGSSRPPAGQVDPRYAGGQPQQPAYGRDRPQPPTANDGRDARRRRMQ